MVKYVNTGNTCSMQLVNLRIRSKYLCCYWGKSDVFDDGMIVDHLMLRLRNHKQEINVCDFQFIEKDNVYKRRKRQSRYFN